MIEPSTLPAEATPYIAGRLHDLAASEGVRILFAIESGSRAWGFPSADSDYDVRFVYVRPRPVYLTVREMRDVIETPTLDDPVLGVPLDLNGWDLRKALRLALGSNPVLHEWLSSPLRYGQDDSLDLQAFVAATARREAYLYHYDRLCRGAWADIEATDGQATVKRYCYALRPALVRLWMAHNDGLPPMDMHSLYAGAPVSAAAVAEMAALFRQKREGGERDAIARLAVLDDLIAGALLDKPQRPPKTDADPALWRQADTLFLRYAGSD